jgi:hypothetical protein
MNATQPQGLTHLVERTWVSFENREHPNANKKRFFVARRETEQEPAVLIHISDRSIWRYSVSKSYLNQQDERYGFVWSIMHVYHVSTEDIIADYGTAQIRSVYRVANELLNQKPSTNN